MQPKLIPTVLSGVALRVGANLKDHLERTLYITPEAIRSMTAGSSAIPNIFGDRGWFRVVPVSLNFFPDASLGADTIGTAVVWVENDELHFAAHVQLPEMVVGLFTHEELSKRFAAAYQPTAESVANHVHYINAARLIALILCTDIKPVQPANV